MECFSRFKYYEFKPFFKKCILQFYHVFEFIPAPGALRPAEFDNKLLHSV